MPVSGADLSRFRTLNLGMWMDSDAKEVMAGIGRNSCLLFLLYLLNE